MTLQQIAKAIAENSDAVNRRAITWQQFSNENHRLWRLVDRGEQPIVGNAASRRCAKVSAYLRSM